MKNFKTMLCIFQAAEKALRSFSDLPFPLPDELSHASDSTIHSTNSDHDSGNNQSLLSSTSNDDPQLRKTPSPMMIEPREIQSGLSPLYLLNQLKRDARFEEILNDDENSASNNESQDFKFVVIVDDQRFLGVGRSKKVAKTRAAQLALEKLFGMCFDKEGKRICSK